MIRIKKLIIIVLSVVLPFILSSCATTPIKPPIILTKSVYPHTTLPVLRQDVFHIVAPGETLWRISKMHDVLIKDILSANNLKTDALEKGQRLLVLGAAPIVPVISLYSSKKWKYIVIHHSATDEGNSLYFDKYHQGKGWEGIGYHFIIDNGTKGKQNGQIEVSPRWIKQQDGAHCRASDMNCKGIGICLVGNFSEEKVSEKQMESLIYLVKTLRGYYNIPIRNILGHGQVPEAKTECPGKYFPWDEFKKRLNK